ncbi:MAG: substrate-binding domain-containing protein [Candidatus Bathyarchaeota archaeon]|nr:MAG: substrate-binding domain-containing protein [Candidatus Bathyarchaeota archaeon]
MGRFGVLGKIFTLVAAVAIVSVGGTAYYMQVLSSNRLIISTTTSLFDTGVLDKIERHFEDTHSIDLNFLSVGTGLAIKFAERGDVDMILVHAPTKEFAFLEGGYGLCRKIVAYNFFTIVGPEADPAEIADVSPEEALTRIANAGRSGETTWVSRGDDSGTHIKEKGLWNNAGFDLTTLQGESWYIEAGAGMGETLLITEEHSAYTLADMGTYLKYFNDNLITLRSLVTQGQPLLNVYSAIAVNRTLHSNANFDGAIAFIKFLVSEEGQQVINDYGQDLYGQGLFFPAARLLEENTNSTLAQWIQEFAFLNGCECPPEYQNGQFQLYS